MPIDGPHPIKHTCNPDGECFCMYDLESNPNLPSTHAQITMWVPLSDPTANFYEKMLEVASHHDRLCDGLESVGYDIDKIFFTGVVSGGPPEGEFIDGEAEDADDD